MLFCLHPLTPHATVFIQIDKFKICENIILLLIFFWRNQSCAKLYSKMSFLYEQMQNSTEDAIIVENEIRDDGGQIHTDGPAGKAFKVYCNCNFINHEKIFFFSVLIELCCLKSPLGVFFYQKV